MKTISVEFYTWAICSTDLEVPDDYQMLGDDPYKILEDICENYADSNPHDLMTDSYYYIPDIDQMGLDYIQRMTIVNDQGKEISSKDFEKIIWDNWSINGK